jgi:hypothetical protein
MDIPCARCASLNIQCTWDNKHKKCAECTHHDVLCDHSFVPDSKWNALIAAEGRIDAQLEEACNLIDSLSSQLATAIAKSRRLERHRKSLKERGLRFLHRDRSALEYLESQEAASASEKPEDDAHASSSSGIASFRFHATDQLL